MPRSGRFDLAVVSPFQDPISRAWLAKPDGTVLYRFSIVDGEVTWQRSNGTITSAAQMTVLDLDDALAPLETELARKAAYGTLGDTFGGMGGIYGAYSQTLRSGVLVPLGNEVHIQRGLRYSDGTEEYITLGVFQLDDIEWNADANGIGTISLTCKDRSILVSRNAWSAPFNRAAGATYPDVIRALVTDRLGEFWRPRVECEFDTDTNLTPQLTYGTSPGGDPWSDACTLARVILKQLYVDRAGNVQLRSTSDPGETLPAFTVTTGENGTLATVRRTLARSKSFNAVIVTGEGSTSTNPIRGEAVDVLADSPTRRSGPFNYVPKIISTPLVTDSAMAQNLANRLFVELLGIYEEATVTFIPNPALELTDVFGVIYPALGMGYGYVIDSLSCPLLPSSLASATVKRRKEDGDY